MFVGSHFCYHSQADVRALRFERRKVAQERKLEAEQKQLLWRQLRLEADERSAMEVEHGKTVEAIQKELIYHQHAKGAFQAQVCSSRHDS